MVGIVAICIVIALVLGLILSGIWMILDNHIRYNASRGLAVLFIIIGIIATIVCGDLIADTEFGQNLLKDTESDISGLERTVKVYTADGTLLAEYEGKFTIGDENGGVSFLLDGKRYIYWNCFIESIEK